MRTWSAAPTPVPALAPLFSPLEDGDDDDDDVDVCNVFTEADVAPVIVIDREFEADEE